MEYASPTDEKYEAEVVENPEEPESRSVPHSNCRVVAFHKSFSPTAEHDARPAPEIVPLTYRFVVVAFVVVALVAVMFVAKKSVTVCVVETSVSITAELNRAIDENRFVVVAFTAIKFVEVAIVVETPVAETTPVP